MERYKRTIKGGRQRIVNNINDLPDIQHSETSNFPIYINQVGVSEVKVPFKLDSLYGGTHELIAKVEMTTDLDPQIKGISMSKLLRTLSNYLDKPLKHDLIRKILEEFKIAVETNSKNSSIKFEFEMALNKKSPKSNLVFPQYYQCSFAGRLSGDSFQFSQKVRVPYASYCPCSFSLCNDLKVKGAIGIPHAQRCYADLLVEVKPEHTVWLETLIEVVENSVSNKVYPLLRRVDEQEVAKTAALNLQFVEDSIRRIGNSLNQEELIFDWLVRCTHEENIHTSNAIAVMWKGISGGLNGSKFL